MGIFSFCVTRKHKQPAQPATFLFFSEGSVILFSLLIVFQMEVFYRALGTQLHLYEGILIHVKRKFTSDVKEMFSHFKCPWNYQSNGKVPSFTSFVLKSYNQPIFYLYFPVIRQIYCSRIVQNELFLASLENTS